MKKEMNNERVYKTIYLISYVGEYELKHSRILVELDALEDFNKDLHALAIKCMHKELSINEDCFSYLHYLVGTTEELKEYAIENSKYLMEVLDDGVGADDGHYDYFPDLVEQFEQLCKQLELKELYNTTIEKIKKHSEYNDEDEEVTFGCLK